VSKRLLHGLSKRERQIMETIYRRRQATVAEVLSEIPDPPSYSAVRATLNILERKGLLTHRKNGLKYVYSPSIPHSKARQTVVRQLLQTYFNGSVEDAVAALIQSGRKRLSQEDFDKLIGMIEKTRREDQKRNG
jgi:BlaI family penicillinase repressor